MPCEPELYGDILGTIYEEGTNEPIQGVTITLGSSDGTATSGSDGKFEFKDLEAKQYTLQVTKSGYISNTKTVTVTASEDVRADIPLTAEKAKPTVTSETPVATSTDKASVSGNITDLGSGNISSHGHVWSTSPAPTTSLTTKVDYGTKDETGVFTSNITGLTAETEYYVRAYATNSSGTSYSNELKFTTPAEGSMATVITDNVSNISHIAATCGGNVTDEGTATVTVKGVCWNTAGNAIITDNKTTDGNGAGLYVSNINGLSANTLYYVRAYATSSEGTTYGDEKQFTTTAGPTTPTVSTAEASNISANTVTLGGDVSSNGGANISERGICYAASENPDISGNHKVASTNETGSFTVDVSGLAATTTYHARAYATNSEGTSYGANISFTTTATPAPTVATQAASSIAQTTATLNGQINANGANATVTFEYGTTTSYGNTINADPSTVTGSSNTSVSSNLTNLTANTTYHFRVKAENSGGTIYGDDMSFTTTEESALPTDGLIAYYPFNGNANDESGNSNNGTVNGATLTSDRNGNANSAYSFDGINDYIEINNPFYNNDEITFTAWFFLNEIKYQLLIES